MIGISLLRIFLLMIPGTGVLQSALAKDLAKFVHSPTLVKEASKRIASLAAPVVDNTIQTSSSSAPSGIEFPPRLQIEGGNYRLLLKRLKKPIIMPVSKSLYVKGVMDGMILLTEVDHKEVFVPEELIVATSVLMKKMFKRTKRHRTSSPGKTPVRRHVTGTMGTGMPFSFQYVVDDEDTQNFQTRHEEGDAFGVVKGCYQLLEPTGSVRTVTYRADDTGFRVISITKGPDKVPCTANGNLQKSFEPSIKDLLVKAQVSPFDIPQRDKFSLEESQKLHLHEEQHQLHLEAEKNQRSLNKEEEEKQFHSQSHQQQFASQENEQKFIAENHHLRQELHDQKGFHFESKGQQTLSNIVDHQRIVTNNKKQLERQTLSENLINQTFLRESTFNQAERQDDSFIDYINNLSKILINSMTDLSNYIHFPFALIPISTFLDLREKGHIPDDIQGFGAVIHPTRSPQEFPDRFKNEVFIIHSEPSKGLNEDRLNEKLPNPSQLLSDHNGLVSDGHPKALQKLDSENVYQANQIFESQHLQANQIFESQQLQDNQIFESKRTDGQFNSDNSNYKSLSSYLPPDENVLKTTTTASINGYSVPPISLLPLQDSKENDNPNVSFQPSPTTESDNFVHVQIQPTQSVSNQNLHQSNYETEVTLSKHPNSKSTVVQEKNAVASIIPNLSTAGNIDQQRNIDNQKPTMSLQSNSNFQSPSSVSSSNQWSPKPTQLYEAPTPNENFISKLSDPSLLQPSSHKLPIHSENLISLPRGQDPRFESTKKKKTNPTSKYPAKTLNLANNNMLQKAAQPPTSYVTFQQTWNPISNQNIDMKMSGPSLPYQSLDQNINQRNQKNKFQVIKLVSMPLNHLTQPIQDTKSNQVPRKQVLPPSVQSNKPVRKQNLLKMTSKILIPCTKSKVNGIKSTSGQPERKINMYGWRPMMTGKY